MSARGTESTVKHEAHGTCRTCHIGVHRYPFGWQHVNLPDFFHEPVIRVTCCDRHAEAFEAKAVTR